MLGQLSIKKKFRWTFEAKTASGDIAFPESFVKISHRPDFPYSLVADENGGHKEYNPGNFVISQFFTFYEDGIDPCDGVGEFAKFLATTLIDHTETGNLRLYDGCGTVIEHWELEGVKIKLLHQDCIDYASDDTIVDWKIDYKKCEYKNEYKNEFKSLC